MQGKNLSWRRKPVKLCRRKHDGADGDRTRDLLVANQALSQLSYRPAHTEI